MPGAPALCQEAGHPAPHFLTKESPPPPQGSPPHFPAPRSSPNPKSPMDKGLARGPEEGERPFRVA